MHEHIFTPLEMTDTAFEPRPEMEERLSIPYTADEKTGSQLATTRLKAAIWPAGPVYGTVLNQARFTARANRANVASHRASSRPPAGSFPRWALKPSLPALDQLTDTKPIESCRKESKMIDSAAWLTAAYFDADARVAQLKATRRVCMK